jgi:hypothetical protein
MYVLVEKDSAIEQAGVELSRALYRAAAVLTEDGGRLCTLTVGSGKTNWLTWNQL